MLTGNLRQAMQEIAEGAAPRWVGTDVEIVLKVARFDAESFQQPGVVVAIKPLFALYDTGAIFNLFCQINDGQERPYGFEIFLNPADPSHEAIIVQLARQQHLDIAVYDKSLAHVFTKRIVLADQTKAEMASALQNTMAHNTEIVGIDYAVTLERFKRDFPRESLLY